VSLNLPPHGSLFGSTISLEAADEAYAAGAQWDERQAAETPVRAGSAVCGGGAWTTDRGCDDTAEHDSVTSSGDKRRYWVVTGGRVAGIYATAEEARRQTDGYHGAEMVMRKGRRAAEEYFELATKKTKICEVPRGRTNAKCTRFYVVTVGRKPGIYYTWDETSEQVTGFRGAYQEKFSTREEAERFYEASMRALAAADPRPSGYQPTATPRETSAGQLGQTMQGTAARATAQTVQDRLRAAGDINPPAQAMTDALGPDFVAERLRRLRLARDDYERAQDEYEAARRDGKNN
jgi:ribonuclease HI